MYEGIVEKEQENVALKAAQAELAENPKAQRAIDHAKTIIERNKLDGTVPQAEVEAAQRRLATAEAGNTLAIGRNTCRSCGSVTTRSCGGQNGPNPSGCNGRGDEEIK